MKKKKISKLTATLIAIIILLTIIAGVSIVYNFLGGFYYYRVIEYDTMLGEEQTIIVDREGAFVSACNFSGSLVVETDIKQVVNVQTKEIQNPLHLRAKCFVSGLDEKYGLMFGFTNWIEATDGYLYFNHPIESFSKVGLCNTLRLSIQAELDSSTNYVMIFVVESSETPYVFEAI